MVAMPIDCDDCVCPPEFVTLAWPADDRRPGSQVLTFTFADEEPSETRTRECRMELCYVITPGELGDIGPDHEEWISMCSEPLLVEDGTTTGASASESLWQAWPRAARAASRPYSEYELDLMARQAAEIELPPEIEEWVSRISGSIKTSLGFDSRTDLDRDGTCYGPDH